MDNMQELTNCSILVPSCDKYSDLWEPFFSLFWRYWPDCPYPVYLGSNHQSFEHPKVKTILVGDDKDWSSGIKAMLETLQSKYVLVILEDFFIRKPVDGKHIVSLIRILEELKGSMLQLRPIIRRPFSRVKGFSAVVRLRKEMPYRVSLQPTIWEREALLSLICEGESAWEFEINASNRSRKEYEAYFCIRKKPPIIWKHHVVERGKWFWHEARRFKKANIGCDFSRRSVMTLREQILFTVRKKLSSLRKRLVPWTFQRWLGRRIRRYYGKMKTF